MSERIECTHGQLARQCNICELEQDLARERNAREVLLVENAALRKERDELKLEVIGLENLINSDEPSAGDRYDDKRDMASVIAHLRYGDSDGQDHDDAADELERLQRELSEALQNLHAARTIL